MLTKCAGRQRDGRRCGAWPMRGEEFCLWHSPAHEEEAGEARRLGGVRRRREKTVAGVYALNGLSTSDDIRRLIEIALLDALGLDNSVARSRVLIAGAQAATKLLETGELESRIASLEAALDPGRPLPGSTEFGEAV